MRKFITNRWGITLLFWASMLLVVLSAGAQTTQVTNMPDLEAIYSDYLSQQERAEKIAEIEENKDAMIHELASKWEAVAQEMGNEESWYKDAVYFLSEKDAESLLLMSEATTWDEFMAAMDGESLLEFGNANSELVFYPLPPCRVADTRIASRWGFNPIPPDGTINVDVSGNEFGQGVPNVAACGVSTDAKAVVINLAAVPVSGQGFLTVWPFASARPLAGQLNYSSLINQVAISNSLIVQACRGCTDEISIFSRPGTTHVVVDVLGYFARPSATAVQSTTVTKVITVAANSCKGDTASCPSGYNVTGGGGHFNFINPNLFQTNSRPFGNGWRINGCNQTGGNQSFNIHAVCARIPGR